MLVTGVQTGFPNLLLFPTGPQKLAKVGWRLFGSTYPSEKA